MRDEATKSDGESGRVQMHVAQLLRIAANPVPDPAAVALLRFLQVYAPNETLRRHAEQWPVARIGREWERFGAETRALFSGEPPLTKAA